MNHLVGIAEIAQMFGVTRQGVHKIIRTHDDFPAPVAVISAGHVYERVAVEKWARKMGRIK